MEPEGAAAVAWEPVTHPGHRIQGGGYAMSDLAQLRDISVDVYLTVAADEAVLTARRLAREEGVFAGFSSGAVVAAALRLLHEGRVPSGGTVAVLLADSGLKNPSTDLWEA